MEALGRGAWKEARSAFEDAARADESAEISFGLGIVLWWLGEIRGSVRYLEQAYAAFRRRSDPMQAASAALELCFLYHKNLGNHAVGDGWMARAARLVDEFDLQPLRGWVLLNKACCCSNPNQSETWARQARQLALDGEDRGLELCALSQIGAALIDKGRIDEGIPLIDEAMAGALACEGQLDTVVITTCRMIESYDRCADFQRAVQWLREADRFIERYGCPYLNVTCRAHYGGVLFAAGDWQKAEEELRAALELSGDAMPTVRGEALARLAELRLAQGRIEEAERLLAGFEGHEAATAVCARIHLLRGKRALAVTLTQRRLDAIGGENRVEGAVLVELLGEAELGQGKVGGAAERGRKLAELGSTLGCQLMFARGERLRGRALAVSKDEAAIRHLEVALRKFVRLEMPFETARTRLLLAQALREDEPEVAEAEARAALVTFENLGANENAVTTATLLREIAAKARKQISKTSSLSRREVEVLCLVAQGMSNQEIADQLALSKHTVHRHVSSILTKLDLHSRAAAAAYAVQHELL
jgi:DNA-binding CsgD family transcriptional regulator